MHPQAPLASVLMFACLLSTSFGVPPNDIGKRDGHAEVKKVGVVGAEPTAPLGSTSSAEKTVPSTWVDFAIKENAKAVMIPVEVEGYSGQCAMQLDSGAPATMLYTKKDGVTPDPKERFAYLNFKVGGVDFGKRPLVKNHAMPATYNEREKLNIIGTIGLDCMVDHVWSLDFIRMRFAVSDFWYQMPAEARKPGVDLPVVLRDQKLFIPVSIRGKATHDYFYDTGVHGHGILTDEEPFRVLSGRTPEDTRNETEEGFSWGKKIQLVKAPCGEVVSLGDYKLKNTTVTFTRNPPENLLFSKYPFKASGLIGNRAFLDRAIVTIEIRDCFLRVIEPGN